jgi:hypothetical protein
VTLVTGDDVVVQRAVVRIGQVGEAIDAWSLGGTAVPVDPATGIMGTGLTRPEHGGRRLTHHPVTEVRFAGEPFPHWDDVAALCTRAARLLPGARSLGWDVLVTADGPVLIEGNRGWNLHMVQVHGPGVLADPPFRRALEDAGIALPTGLPRNPLTRAFPVQVARRLTRPIRRRRRR